MQIGTLIHLDHLQSSIRLKASLVFSVGLAY